MGTTVNGIYVPDNGESGWGDEVSANQRRLADRGFNVKAYGAVGDGTTVDTTAIQAAVDAMGTGGGRLIFPPSAGYKFGALTWPTGSGSTDKWTELEIYGKLIPTATINIPARRFAIIGKAGAVWNQFQNYPAAEIDGTNISSGRVVELSNTGTSIWLEGLHISNVNGSANGIECDQGVTEVRLRGVHVQMAAGSTGNAWRSYGGFGYYFEHCGFAGVAGGGKSMRFESATAADVPRDISLTNCFINYKGIQIKSTSTGEGNGYRFERMLFENMEESCFHLDSSTATLAGFSMRHIDTDDATQSPHCLIKNTGSGTHHVTVSECDGMANIVESGSSLINGLWHTPGRGGADVGLGSSQTALYRTMDRFGKTTWATVRADTMQVFSSGTTINVSGTCFMQLTHGSVTTITDFTSETPGQILEILFTNSNVTIAHGTPIKLAGGVNFVGTANDILRLRSDGTTWYEVSRSVNG
jgi:hypothetical protein